MWTAAPGIAWLVLPVALISGLVPIVSAATGRVFTFWQLSLAMPDAVVSACTDLDGVEVLWINRYAAGGNIFLDLEAVEDLTAHKDTAMDRLIVMDEGRIIEQGNHADLLRKGGLYARLWARQSGGFLAPDVDGEGRFPA